MTVNNPNGGNDMWPANALGFVAFLICVVLAVYVLKLLIG